MRPSGRAVPPFVSFKSAVLKRTLVLLLLTLVSYSVLAQYVQGVVLDDALNEPLPGAHVFYLEDKTTMQVTDYNGHFKIPIRKGTLQVSMMGFETYSVEISGSKRLSVRLKEASSQMKEVEVKVKKQRYSRKNNPAVEMMKKVIAAKADNDLRRNNFFSYRKYEKVTFSLNEFTEKVFDDDHFKRFPQLREHVEYCPETGKLILPLMVQEQVMRRVYRKEPRTEKTIVDGKRDNGVNEFFSMDMLETIIGDLFREIDIYKDNIRFMQHEFVSPISSGHAIAFYRYFIVDTLDIAGTKCYQLDFTPNNSYDVGFSGALFIQADSSWRVKRAEISIPKMANLNYMDQLDLHQNFMTLPSGDQVLFDSKMIAQLKLANWIQKAQVERLERMTDFSFDPIDKSVFKFNGDTKIESSAEMRDEAFWENVRPVPLTKTESTMDLFVKRLSNIPGFKQLLWVLKAFIDNYVETNMDPTKPSKFDFGPINTTFAWNKVEGFKLRLSGMTTAALNPHLFAEGYVGYGFGDKQVKGMGKVTYSINEKKALPFEYPVNNISAEYYYDVVTPTDRFIDTDKDNVVTAWKWTSLDHQAYTQRFHLQYDREWENGLRFTTGYRRERMEGARNLFYQEVHSHGTGSDWAIPEPNLSFDQSYNRRFLTLSEFHVRLEWQPGVTWLNSKQRRRKTNYDSPVIAIGHIIGIKDFLGGDYMSNQTVLELGKRFWLRSWGRFDIYAKVQRQWNQVPFPMLVMPASNFSYVIQDNSFSLIDNYEFLTDKNVTLMLSWEMNGKLFNRIPGLRKLKIHEFIGARLFWGDLSEKNNPYAEVNRDGSPLMYFPGYFQGNGTYKANFQPLDMSRPYIELVAGIHNIFNLIHIEYVHRINYLRPGTQTWGIRYTFRMYM